MASDNRSLLDLLRQGQGQAQGQAHGHDQQLPPQQQQQQVGDMSPPSISPHPFYHTMGPPPPMGQMMPGFGFPQQAIDQHPMYLPQVMQHGQRGPTMVPFPPGAPLQGRPPPQGNTLSLLQSLNQPAAVSPGSSSVPTFANVPQGLQQPPQQQQQQMLHQEQFSQANLQATENLKLALFGPPKQDTASAQQQTEDLRMALFGGSRSDPAQPLSSPKKEEVRGLAVNVPLPTPQSDTNLESTTEVKLVEPKRESTVKSPVSKDSTPHHGPKSKFTYVNPFHSFTSTASATSSASAAAVATTPAVATTTAPAANTTSPSHSRTTTPITGSQENVPAGSRSSFSTPVPRRETPTHTETEASHHPHDQRRFQPDQLLPPHSAWNHRVQKLAKGSSSIPDGVYLSHPGSGATVYDTELDNLDAIFSEDLETIPITLINTDVEYHHGKSVAVSKGFISYAAKGGKIRVIQQAYGHRALLRAHTDQVLDLSFSPAYQQDISGTQLLASVGKDSKLVVWDLSGSDADSTDIAHSKYLEVVGTPTGDQPHYSRIAWSPANPFRLALVNNDDHSVYIIDVLTLTKTLASELPVVTEAQLLPHVAVIQAHSQAINDISFSRDGSVLLTASEDGSIKFWDLYSQAMVPTLLKEFEPYGGLGVTSAMFVDEPDATTSRCVVTGCRRGTELSLWHVAGFGPLDQIVFKEPSVSTRRPSVGKPASRLQDMSMFNVMGYDPETSSLVLANSARLSLIGLKIKVTSTSSSDNESLSSTQDQASYIRNSVTLEESPCAASFDFLIEYPMPQHIISFVVMPDSSLEYNGFSVYCMQSKVVQQYIIKGLEPHDKHRCQTFVSASHPAKNPESKSKTASQGSAAKSINSSSSKANDGAESSVFKAEKDVTDPSNAATVAPPESQDKDLEKSIKLHGPVINGAIAKLKEKKRNTATENQAVNEGSVEKKDSPKIPATGRTGRKGSQDSINTPQQEIPTLKKGQASSTEPKAVPDTAKTSARNTRQQLNRNQDVVEPLPASEQPLYVPPGGQITISTSELQSLLQTMEDRISTRFEKKLSAELEQQYRKIDQDQISRQEVVLKMVSQTLSKNTEQLLVQTVHKEIQNAVVPSLNKIVGTAVERQLSRTINETISKALPSAVESSVTENVGRILTGPAFLNNLTTQVAAAIRPSIEESFKDSFTKVLIPSYQKATQAMFQQIHGAFQSGIGDLTTANTKDHAAIEALATNVQKVASTVESIHNNLSQVAQAQSESIPSGFSRLDQQRRSITSLQRTLQGEDLTGPSGGNSRRPSQQLSPVDSKQNGTISQQVAYGDFEGAFTQALSTSDSNTVFVLCNTISPRSVFQQTSANRSGTLSQPVLLALAHHLANEQLSQNLSMKLPWLQEVIYRLNPKDPVVGDHLTGILPSIQKRLEDCYRELLAGGETSPHAHVLEQLLRYIRSMRP